MEISKAIKERRSIRKYLDKDISFETIFDILEVGSYAANAGNMQNWRFLVVKDKENREKIADACLATWMNQAPVHIVVCNDGRDISRLYKKKGERFGVQNCAAAMQNILLAAYDKGLGSCWVGVFNGDKLRSLLKIPEDVPIEGIITLGYAAIKPGPRDNKQGRRHKLEYVTFFEKYGERELDFSMWPLSKHLKKLKKVDLGKFRRLFKK